MPLVERSEAQPHRDKISDVGTVGSVPFSAFVARKIPIAQAMNIKAAKLALDTEWQQLVDQVVWEEDKVRPWAEVKAEAARRGETVHVGNIFELCHEKNWELPDGHPLKKYKGRSVFQGNEVKDEEGNYAMFAELSSSPATMALGKCVDAYGALEGNSVQQADAKSAYT